MLTRDQKSKIIQDLTKKIQVSKSLVFSDYTGTTVGKMKKLRDELRKTGASYKITKKKLIEIALKEADISIDVKSMQGQIGIALGGEDETSAAKVLAKFSKENKNFKILSGVLEKKEIAGKEVLALAALPSKEEMLAKLVRTINAPVSGFVNALAGNIRNLVGVLKAIGDNQV